MMAADGNLYSAESLINTSLICLNWIYLFNQMLHFLSVCMYCLPKCCFIELVEENTLCFYTVGDIMANDLRFYDDVRK